MRRILPTLALTALFTLSCGDDSPTSPGQPGTSPNYSASFEYFVGRVNSLWQSSSGDLYTTGSAIMHYDGEQWDPITLPKNDSFNGALWTTTDGTLYAEGGSDLYRFDGQEWHSMSTALHRVWGAENGEIFAAGMNQFLYHYDGSAWSADSVKIDDQLPYVQLITGDGPDDVFAITDRGDIIHFDGDHWATAHLASDYRYFYDTSAYKAPGGPLYFNGSDSLFTYDGLEVQLVETPLRWVRGMYGRSATEIYAFGPADYPNWDVVRFDGTSWHPEFTTERSIRDIVASTDEGTIYFADGYRVYEDRGGTQRTILGFAPSPDRNGYIDGFSTVWGSEEAGVIVVGTHAYQLRSGVWTDLRKHDLTYEAPNAIWGRSSRELYGVGRGMLLHYDGNDWTLRSGAADLYLNDVAGDERDVVAVGYAGAVVRYNGTSWTRDEQVTSYDLYAVCVWEGKAFAGGQSGALIYYDGREWRPVISPVSWSIYDFLVLGANQIVAVGSDGTEICVYNGHEWEPIFMGYVGGANNAVWGTSMRDLFIAKSNGNVVHYDGRSVDYLPRITNSSANDIWCDQRGNVFATHNGNVVRYARSR